MRFNPKIFDIVKSGNFVGKNRSNGRVTVEPLWSLQTTPSHYGSSQRGPYRWFQDVNDSGVEWEIPNIKSISWDRSESQDLATCDITLYNVWHEENGTDQELDGQLGKPGYFWPKRGLEVNRWGQVVGTGSFRKDGTWDPNFSWRNVLVQYALIRTYEGYGGHSTEEEFKSIQSNLDDGNLLITGTWLVKSVVGGSSGEITLNCLDMGKLVLDPICFPPLVPDALYPLEYHPEGKTAFDSVWGPTPKAGTSAGSQGEVHTTYTTSSLDVKEGKDAYVDGHTGKHSNDGDWKTFSISNAAATPAESVWFEFFINQKITKLSLKAWAGGYTCYISGTNAGGADIGTEVIPGTSKKYIKKVNIPLHIPDNEEDVVNIELPREFLSDLKENEFGELSGGTVHIKTLRLTFTNLYYYGGPGNKYRAGIRDLIVYRQGDSVDPYVYDYNSLPTSSCMAIHPTRGYWIADLNGTVHGFGDAADYDSTAFGQVPISAALDSNNHGPYPNWTGDLNPNRILGMDSQVDGKGYWVVDLIGHVYAYGTAVHYGDHVIPYPSNPLWAQESARACGIARTYTGKGYWVAYTDGVVKGFGDAAGIIPPGSRVPATPLSNALTAADARYDYQSRLQSITAHPNKLGFWAVSRAGEVFSYGEAKNYGGLDHFIYNRGMADSWAMQAPVVSTIETTASGDGYWIATFDGKIGGFGDAIGKGPVSVYDTEADGLDVVYDDSATLDDDHSFFRALIWDVARDPDGSGFWVLVADGSVLSYDADFWGRPSYSGLSGWRWHAGNFSGEYSEIIKELCMWAGFTFYEEDLDGNTAPYLFGEIESTGIYTSTSILPDKFDKRPIIDIIKELCEVVAYRLSFREDGGVKVTSPNIWRAGNWDEDGARIYVSSGTYDRVDESNEDAIEFVPIIDESVDMLSYGTTLDSDSMRSELIIGTEVPSAKDPSITDFVRFEPRSGNQEVSPGIKALRNIPRVGLWISQIFQNPEEVALMAELISLLAWFAERNSTTTCKANPCISVGDQIKLYERYTSEIYNHYVSGISSTHDLDSGEWTYSITTHWLGDKDHWVITADARLLDDPDRYIEISERLDKWQLLTGRALEQGAMANNNEILGMEIYGEFSKTVYQVGDIWAVSGSLSVGEHLDSIRVSLKRFSSPLGTEVYFGIFEDGTEIASHIFKNTNELANLGPIGLDGQNKNYSIVLLGTSTSTGNGAISFSVSNPDGSMPTSFEDSALIVLPSNGGTT